MVKRNRKRWSEHRDALMQLEFYLNEIMGILADNRAHARVVLSSASDAVNTIEVVWSEPRTLPRDMSFIQSFLRRELINALFSYNQTIRKLNNDTGMIRESYSEMRSAFLSRNLERSKYLGSLEEYRNGMRALKKAYRLMDDRTIDLLARTRATLTEDKVRDKGRFFKLPIPKDISRDEVNRELKRLREEIEQVRSRSRDELDEYF